MSAEDIDWNANYDVVVLGFGGAGGTAARFASDHGAKVLLIDAAPYGHEGGNTRYSAQHIEMAHDLGKISKYYDNLAKPYEYSKKTMDTYLHGMVDMPKYIEKYLGVKPFIWSRGYQKTDKLAHKTHLSEYPEYEGADTVDFALMHNRDFDAALWKVIRKNVLDRKDQIDIWLNTRGKRLITNENNEVIGVEVERNHHKYFIHASQGVVLATGGFENNHQMQQNYLHVSALTPLGTLYNKGDGVNMAARLGAKMWHMSNYESLGIVPSYVIAEKDGERGRQISRWANVKTGSIFAVTEDGTRFMREDAPFRHGHIYEHGEYLLPHAYDKVWLIFDEKQYQKFEAEKDDGTLKYANLFEKIIEGKDINDLAQKINVPAENLEKTINQFNNFAKNQKDFAFGRKPETLTEFSGEKRYAIRLAPAILNTQGGPAHNEKAQVLDMDDQPIKRLYEAGELGGMCVNRYQGGGNLAECLIFGKIAGENVAQEEKLAQPLIKQPIPSINDALANDSLKNIKLDADQYLGSSEAGIGGKIVVKVTYANHRIKDIDIVENHETEGIGSRVIKELPSKMVEENTTDVDAISGASTTTRALKEAVNKAINKSGEKR